MSKKVLIVEDEYDIAQLLEFYLKKNGFEVVIASDGEAGLLGLAEHKPDILILDLMLPKISGEEVCRKIRKDKTFGGLPIIMLTAKASDADRIIGRVIGADYYLTKPFELKEILDRINSPLK